MKIFKDSAQIKKIESATLASLNITSNELVERASLSIFNMFNKHFTPCNIFIVAGKGGNGADGVAIARLASEKKYNVTLLLTEQTNLSSELQEQLSKIPKEVEIYTNIDPFFDKVRDSKSGVVIDALFGAGYTLRPHSNDVTNIITDINNLNRDKYSVVAIDTPSGIGCTIDDVSPLSVNCTMTIAVYSPKLPTLLPTTGAGCGIIEIATLEYDNHAIDECHTPLFYTTEESVNFPLRNKFAHKGHFGSLLIIGGGKGMVGASIVAAKGALSTGCGAVTIHIPKKYASVAYSTIPSAMVSIDKGSCFTSMPENIEKYSAVCVGMGVGKHPKTIQVFRKLLTECHRYAIPVILDADALNIIAENRDMLKLIPKGSILTPHLGEFKRLVREFTSESEKLDLLKSVAMSLGSTVILKGAHTVTCSPLGTLHFNSSGNPAMARAASGDLLAGMVASLSLQHSPAQYCARAAVYLHGKAADRAVKIYGERFLTLERWIEQIY